MKIFQALIFICEDIAKILNLANTDIFQENSLAFLFILLMMKQTGGVFNRLAGGENRCLRSGFHLICVPATPGLI